MKLAPFKKYIKSGACIAILGLLNYSCSSAQQEEELLTPASDESTAEASSQDTAAPEPEPEPTPDPSVDLAAPPSPAPALLTTAPTTSAPKGPSSARVLRYVTGPGAPLLNAANDSATEVGRLKKGDIVMVTEEGDWARINDTTFIKTVHLSKKALPRERSNAVWLPPSK